MTFVNNQEKERTLPIRINRLQEFANNLWWSWHEEGRQVFRSLDYALWRTSGHNPVKQLFHISNEKLESAARDPAFLELFDSVMQKFDIEMSGKNTWWQKEKLSKQSKQIAYFSAEYAIHNSLPIYAGGLGVLAGDICKESSDLGLPMVAIGFMYPQGYFRQHITAEAEQVEEYAQIKFNEAPISPCPWSQGCGPFIPIQLADREIYVKVWLVKVGRVDLFLLDTDVDLNEPQDRKLSARLYTADQEERIRQLIVLGVGGVRTLRELKVIPDIWHANEDHTAFMILERLREELTKGISFETAIENIRKTTIFTTHTPVPAGQHIFPDQMIDYYLHNFWEKLGIDSDNFLKLGKYDDLPSGSFSLTALALRLARRSNAVSQLHSKVSMKMWRKLWLSLEDKEEPITYVTNGVHLPSWQAPKIIELCRKYLRADLFENQTNEKIWQCIVNIPDNEYWEIRQQLKHKLIQTIRDRAQERWTKNAVSSKQVIAMGALLDPYALTIAFTRRFTSYKRPHLILSDIERIKKIITDPLKPVQIIFAGKSHPADYQSKQLLKYVYRLAMDDSFLGKIVFVEDYNMSLARDLVRGVDVWLNNPRRLQEACGTSGMKASMNGIINLSILDGWWAEAYNKSNGWAIGSLEQNENQEEQDKADAESIYNLLEKEIVPLYYDRDLSGIPHRWIKKSKEAIKSIGPAFNACRMMKEYTKQMYFPSDEIIEN